MNCVCVHARLHACMKEKRKSSDFGFIYYLQHFRGSQQSQRKLLLISFHDKGNKYISNLILMSNLLNEKKNLGRL